MAITLEGLEDVLGRLEDIQETKELKRALGRACAVVERAAKKKAPKGIGELRRSITSEVKGTEGIVFTPLEYAPYVEFGTGLFAEEEGRKDVPWHYQDDKGEWHTTYGQHPKPYMRPALNENREKIIEILKEGLTK